MPGLVCGVGAGDELDADEPLVEVEHAVEHGVEGEVGGDFEGVDAVFFEQDAVGVVAPVPDLEGVVVAGAALAFALEQGEVVGEFGCEAGFEVGEEVEHVVGRFGHAQFEHVGGPGGVAESACDFVAHGDCFFEQFEVGVGGLVVVFEEEFAAQFGVVRGVEEGVQFGVVEGDAVGGCAVFFGGAQALDVGVGQTVELGAGEVDGIFVVVDVAAELDAEADEAFVQVAHDVALFGGELEAVASVVAQGEFEQARGVVGQGFGFGACGVGLECAVEFFAEAEAGGEDVEALLFFVGGVAQFGVGGDLGEEAEASVGLADQVADFVEGEHGVVEAALGVGDGGDGVDAALGVVDGVGDAAADVVGCGVGPVGGVGLGHMGCSSGRG